MWIIFICTVLLRKSCINKFSINTTICLINLFQIIIADETLLQNLTSPQPPSQSLPTLDIRLGMPIFLFRGYLLEHCDMCEFYCDWTLAVQCWQAIQLLLKRDIHVCMTKRDRLYSAFSPSLITGSEIRYSLCSSELYMVQNGNVKLFQLLH